MAKRNLAWLPSGTLPGTAQALSVPDPGRPITRDLYLSLLEAKLDQLIQADRIAARQAMEMSEEHSPELSWIAAGKPLSEWASALVRCDGLMPLLSPLTWQGILVEPEPMSLGEILERLTP